ncbi:MAG: SRPBCC family protein [Deltaproteobacteria bacterium]|nr:SRPBCC family protein [Deltaproteobacteria bacterium]
MRLDWAENEVVIRKAVDPVFNFIARGAEYHRWHFDYHLRAEPLDIRPGVVGSVFCIEEIVDGFYLRHVGRVARYEPGRRFAWRARFALFPWIWIGTDFDFEPFEGGTRVHEVLYFDLSPLLLPVVPAFIRHRAFRPEACRRHILDELSGVKTMLEAGDHAPADVADPLTDVGFLSRVKRYRTEGPRSTATATP